MFFQSGGDDAEPVFGRLGSVEPIAKPTEGSVFVFLKAGKASGVSYEEVRLYPVKLHDDEL